MTTEAPTIHRALAAVMADVDKISKDKRNQQQGFNFRGIDDVMNVLHGPLVKHGVIVLPTVEDRLVETRPTRNSGTMNVVHLRVRYDFFGPAGDSVSAVVWGEAQDSADKATNKALSAAMKYAMLQTFCVPTDDMPDADGDDQPPTQQATAAKRMRAAQQEATTTRSSAKKSEGGEGSSPSPHPKGGEDPSGHTPSDATGRDLLRDLSLSAGEAGRVLAEKDKRFRGWGIDAVLEMTGAPLAVATVILGNYQNSKVKPEEAKA